MALSFRNVRWLAALLVPLLATTTARADALSAVERLVSWRYPVAQMRARDLARLGDATRPLLFDVRGEEEYAVSHLPSAIRISPERDADDFLREYRARLRNHGAVFYCTVGARSSRLAWAVHGRLRASDVFPIYNLRGGILRWQATELPLENAMGVTSWVHPYDAVWARLAPVADRLTEVPRNDPPSTRR